MIQKIIVVCVGNICRSPYAEAVLKTHLPDHEISSAGILVSKFKLQDNFASRTAIEVARERDIDLTKHRSTQLSSRSCLDSDLILVMENNHINMISNNISSIARGKTFLLGKWIGSQIEDPYGKPKEIYKNSYDLIEQSCIEWSNRLNN